MQVTTPTFKTTHRTRSEKKSSLPLFQRTFFLVLRNAQKPASPPVSPIVGAMSNSVRPTWSFIFEQTKLSLILRRTLRHSRPLLRRQSKIENHPTVTTADCRQGCWGFWLMFFFSVCLQGFIEGWGLYRDRQGRRSSEPSAGGGVCFHRHRCVSLGWPVWDLRGVDCSNSARSGSCTNV